MKVFNNVYTRFACALILSVGLFAYASCSGAGGGSSSGALSAADSVSTAPTALEGSWVYKNGVTEGTVPSQKIAYTFSGGSYSCEMISYKDFSSKGGDAVTKVVESYSGTFTYDASANTITLSAGTMACTATPECAEATKFNGFTVEGVTLGCVLDTSATPATITLDRGGIKQEFTKQ